MDRFSSRLAAGLIDDRHREATAARRISTLRRVGRDGGVGVEQGDLSRSLLRRGVSLLHLRLNPR